jgi:xanthine dehydrogenase molybdopterin-binding subunit B
VVKVLLAEDVFYNHIGAVVKDEEVFASVNPLKPTITSVGQILGVVVGTTLKAAQAGALAVKVP